MDETASQLLDDVLALGSLVESVLLDSVDLLQRSDLDTMERLSHCEHEIHRRRLAIEMGCLALIAGQQFGNGGLRPLVAMTEIAAELERVGEHARRIARVNYLAVDSHLRRPLVGIHDLAGQVHALLDEALAALSHKDLAAAQAVIAAVQDVDGMHRQVHGDLLAVMTNRPRIAGQAIFLSRAAYHLKRISDRVASIGDWVVYAN
jgi:phosphate transport system protein